MSSFKKTLTACFLALFIISSVPAPAHAALSEDVKDQLDDVIAALRSYLDASEAVSYLYKGYLDKVGGRTTSTSSRTPANTTTSSPYNAAANVANGGRCEYATNITKTLDIGMTDPQVRTLQKLFNTLARDNSAYQPVTTYAEGSLGNETTYYGTATQNAVTRWQAANMGATAHTKGVVDTNTRTKMKSVYCGATQGSASTANTSTNTSTQTPTPNTSTSVNSCATNSSNCLEAGKVSIVSPGYRTSFNGYGYNPELVAPSGSSLTVSGYSSGLNRLQVNITNAAGVKLQQCGVATKDNFLWRCTTNNPLKTTDFPVKVEIWSQEDTGTTYKNLTQLRSFSVQRDSTNSPDDSTWLGTPSLSLSANSVKVGGSYVISYNTAGQSRCFLPFYENIGGGVYVKGGTGEYTWTGKTPGTYTYTMKCDGASSNAVSITVEN